MDIDGVVIRGKTLIPGSAEAVRRLRAAGVPYCFMTNGGGVTEQAKAAELAALLGDAHLDGSQVLLSHTPMRELAKRYEGRRVMILGGTEGTPAVAESYGFDVKGGMVVTPWQVAAGTPDLYPRRMLEDGVASSWGLPPVDANGSGPAIEAALILHDPINWGLELQVLTDVLAGGHPLGHREQPTHQAAALYASNPDFVWQAAYPVVRFGQGAFLDCLRAVWRRYSSGAELQVTEFGKPHRVQFDAARKLVEARAAGGALGRIYMVGDNPAADVRGANQAGGPWRSVLVRTGVFRDAGTGNDVLDLAWRVEDDLGATVERLLATADEDHLGA